MELTREETDELRNSFRDEINAAMGAEFARLRNKYGLNDWAAFYEYCEHSYNTAVEQLANVCVEMFEEMAHEKEED